LREKIAQIGEFVQRFNKLQQIFTRNSLTFLYNRTKNAIF